MTNAIDADGNPRLRNGTVDIGAYETPAVMPGIPTGVSASAGTYLDKIRISWAPASNAGAYLVYRNTTNASGAAACIGTSGGTNYDDSMATAGLNYYYWVKATNAVGASAFSASASGWRRAVFTITAAAGANGTIAPSGAVAVVQGASQGFTILPNAGYHVASLQVDGAPAAAAGVYTFENVAANHSLTAEFAANQPPLIVLSAAPRSGVAPLRVLFDFTGSTDPDGAIAKYEVDRTGDGIYDVQSTESSAFYVEFAAAGTYQAVARVTDNNNAASTTSVTIQVNGVSPVAVIEAQPASGTAPLTVSFAGTNSVAPQGRELVAYEWDFDGDGVYDRLTVDELTEWTYREAGTFSAILRVTDDTGMKAESSVTVVVALSPLPPPAVTLAASPDSGYLPLTVVFTAQLGAGQSSTNYQWDFDGDGEYDARTSTGSCSHIYTAAGTYPARVEAMNAAGLTGSGTVTVRVSQAAAAIKVWISTPKDGSRVKGTAVSLMGHAAPANLAAAGQFQYKPAASNEWIDLGEPIIPTPHAYGRTWDVSGLPAASYDLRLAVADTLGATVYSESIRITVASSSGKRAAGAAPGDIEEGIVAGRHTKIETFGPDASATALLYDGTRAQAPMGTVDAAFTFRVVLTGANAHPTNGSAYGRECIQANREVGLEGNPLLQKPVSVAIPYSDDDNNGIVDGTRVKVSSLTMHWFDPESGQWRLCLETGVYPDEKRVVGKAYRLAEFGVFGAACETPIHGDFDGDRKSDPAIYQAAGGLWRVLLSGAGYRELQFGLGGPDWKAVPADYDADHKIDPGVYGEKYAYWYGYVSASNYAPADAWLGGPGCLYVPSDYDGDGKADPAVYKESSGFWGVLLSVQDSIIITQYGGVGYSAIPADYDGDRKTDIAVYHEGAGLWHVMVSGGGYETVTVGFGGPGWAPVQADYDGDGRTDPALYNRSSGQWVVWMSNSGYSPAGTVLGGPGYWPVPGDYDGAGRVAPGIYHEVTGEWQVLFSGSGYAPVGGIFGGQDFIPVVSVR